MDVHDYVLNFDEEATRKEMEETEREARRVLERDAMMKEYFDQYFMSYFPQYLLKHGPIDVLAMIDRGAIKEYLRNESVPEIEAAAAKLVEEQRKLESEKESFSHSRVYYDAVMAILDADTEEVPDSEFRSKALDFCGDAIAQDFELDNEELDREMAEAEAEYMRDLEDERLMIQSEAEEIYRKSQY